MSQPPVSGSPHQGGYPQPIGRPPEHYPAPAGSVSPAGPPGMYPGPPPKNNTKPILYGGLAVIVVAALGIIMVIIFGFNDSDSGGSGGGGETSGDDVAGAPGETVEDFVDLVFAGDVEGASTMVCSESISSFEADVESTMGMDAETLEYLDISVDVQIEDERIEEDTAEVDFTLTISGMGETEEMDETAQLKQEDGEWKVCDV